jgi:hypothetical protein
MAGGIPVLYRLCGECGSGDRAGVRFVTLGPGAAWSPAVGQDDAQIFHARKFPASGAGWLQWNVTWIG